MRVVYALSWLELFRSNTSLLQLLGTVMYQRLSLLMALVWPRQVVSMLIIRRMTRFTIMYPTDGLIFIIVPWYQALYLPILQGIMPVFQKQWLIQTIFTIKHQRRFQQVTLLV